ncbi:MAG: glutamine synthetase type III, partial [Oscillospiraceae bacterium]|nr:glutamine synthetase type III [Oscillospiraceae bacterium]
SEAYEEVVALEEALMNAKDVTDSVELARYYHDSVFTRMNALRATVDQMETMTSSDYWPYPSYGELLFSVR